MALDGLTLRVSLTCRQCHQPLHVPGLVEEALCPRCTGVARVPASAWRTWFDEDTVRDAASSPVGTVQEIRVMSGDGDAKVAIGRRMPRCPDCTTAVAPDDLAATAGRGGLRCACGTWISCRPASPLARQVVPTARFLVGEGPLGAPTAEPAGANVPLLFSCQACSASLKVDGARRDVVCAACGGVTYLPDGVWLRLHPPHTVRTFFLVYAPMAAPAAADDDDGDDDEELPGRAPPARRPLWWLGPAIAAFVVMVLVASFGLVGLLLVGPRALRHLF
jgi:hypothetical protein